MKKVIILNGPPGSGKDTIATYLCQKFNCKHMEFKSKLFDIACMMANMSKDDWFARYNSRLLKEQPWDKLGGISQREFLIRISEEWIKPTFGKNYFGVSANFTMQNSPQESFVFSDGGFDEEVKAIDHKTFDITIVRLYRNGCSYNGDSRKHLYLPDYKTHEFINDFGTHEELFKALDILAEKIFKEECLTRF